MELTQKSNLVDWLFLPKNKDLLNELEEKRNQEIVTNYEVSLSPMTKEQFITEALIAENDIKEGRVFTQEEVEKESETW